MACPRKRSDLGGVKGFIRKIYGEVRCIYHTGGNHAYFPSYYRQTIVTNNGIRNVVTIQCILCGNIQRMRLRDYKKLDNVKWGWNFKNTY